jgi:hypothetical protein
MPIHDWTCVPAGIFHDFHHEWISEIKRALNRILSGTDYYALAEQVAGGFGPDVLTLQRPAVGPRPSKRPAARPRSGEALAMAPPKARFHIAEVPKWYANRKKAVVVRHVSEHRPVAVLEIVSPGNKDSRTSLVDFVDKTRNLLAAGVHVSLVDLFPPTRRDPQGIHPEVWGEDEGHEYRFDPAKPLTCAAYVGGGRAQAFVEPVGVGDDLPDLPVFLTFVEYVEAPLEATYRAAFDALPEYWRDVMARAGARPRRRRSRGG